MSTKSLLRTTGVASPSRAAALKTPSTSSPRGILKRPPPLPLSSRTQPPQNQSPRTPTQNQNESAFPFAASISVLVSPLLPKSPHVHFPPSAKLTSTFSTHSPNSYDRGAIVVSPNPLELPPWGARVYSPSSDSFATAQESLGPGDVTPTTEEVYYSPPEIVLSPAPNVEVFPTTGESSPMMTVAKPTTRAGLRFQAIASQPSIRPVKGLGRALKLYPRSPYPSAPSSPLAKGAVNKENVEEDLDAKEGEAGNGAGGRPLRANTVYGSNPTRVSCVSSGGGRRKVPPPPPLPMCAGVSPAVVCETNSNAVGTTYVSSPYPQEFLSPVVESPQRTITPTTHSKTLSGSDESLTKAFWESMSLDQSEMRMRGGLPVGPESELELGFEYGVGIGREEVVMSPGLFSPMVFATKEGVLSVSGIESDRDTPTLGNLNTDVKGDPRSLMMSPSPVDPFSAFPSFAAVLSLEGAEGGEVIRYPPRAVVLEEEMKA